LEPYCCALCVGEYGHVRLRAFWAVDVWLHVVYIFGIVSELRD
jgi:hypothetical protein